MNFNIFDLTAGFYMNLNTKLDEGTGDYYPYMDMTNFALDAYSPDLEYIEIIGGTQDQKDAVQGVIKDYMFPMFLDVIES